MVGIPFGHMSGVCDGSVRLEQEARFADGRSVPVERSYSVSARGIVCVESSNRIEVVVYARNMPLSVTVSVRERRRICSEL